MEIRAPYVIVGVFVLAAIAAVFGFVFWLNHAGGLGERTVYHVQFDAPVSGLLVGAAVLFNGIRVGEVAELKLPQGKPRAVLATVSIATATPVRRDTKAGLEFQGDDSGPAVESNLTLVADPMASQSMTVAARNALARVDSLIADNSGSLSDIIANLKLFAAALGKNSGRIEGILQGVEKMTGAGTTPPAKTIYDLTAPSSFPPVAKRSTNQLSVADPTTTLQLDTQKILRVPSDGDAGFADVQWSDSIPKLVQARLVQAFENFDAKRGVSRDTAGVSADEILTIDIRSFQVSMENGSAADVGLTAKLVSKDGRIVKTKVFKTRQSIGELNAMSAVTAINEAFSKTAADIVAWASEAQ